MSLPEERSTSETGMIAVSSDAASSISDSVNEIRLENIPGTIINNVPKQTFRLGTWTVIALVLNRMIGSGIFSSPSTVIKGSGSTAVALLLWGAGAIIVSAGTYIMIELGLSIPRYFVDGVEQAVPQNGGPVVFVSRASFVTYHV